ncbi:MAG: hypothetical protein JXB29_06295 [Sedimentisphaerales bacterium]|nr:hypothetical protein [Sedimentisphaerales bacterium]
MEQFNYQSRESIYFGVSYVVASVWSSDAIARLEFQKTLAKQQLDFARTRVGIRDFALIRTEPSALEVKVASLGPQVSSITIFSERPTHSLKLFVKEAEAVCDAYRDIFIRQQCQILQCNATVRHLYSCTEHAFKYLWEQRLGQDPGDFRYLGDRPVSGGGLRLLMPAARDEQDPVQIEIKIESFLREPRKMFIETIFAWPKPRVLPADGKFDPQQRLGDVEDYATSRVCDFLVGGKPPQ